jgi:hypothetical protein
MKAALSLSLLVVLADQAHGYSVKNYASTDCSGSPTRTDEDGACVMSGNTSMKFGKFEPCEVGGKLNIVGYSNKNCAGTGTASQLKNIYEIDECTKISGGSVLVTCGAYGTASISALAIGAAILMSFL